MQRGWEQKLHSRNQQAKVAPCLTLVQQSAEVAGAISWNFEKATPLVNCSEKFTNNQSPSVTTDAMASRPELTLKYVFKDAKSALPINRKVHDRQSRTTHRSLVRAGALWREA